MEGSTIRLPARLDVPIEGMSCAACVRRVERAAAKVPGVEGVAVNLATETASLQTGPGFDPAQLLEAIERAGYHARLPQRGAASPAPSHGRDRALTVLACVLALPLVAPMLLMPFGLGAELPGAAQLVLAMIVQVLCGARFYRGAWKALRAGAGDMDTLVALGTSAAFLLSCVELAHGGPLYFEASAVVIALVRVGKWLEGRARREAGEAIRALGQLRPERARALRDGATTEIPTAALRRGDMLLLRPGERIPADGIVREGAGSVDESLLTGESRPVAKSPGARVVGGSLNGEAVLTVEATTLGAESTLDRMVRLVADAQAQKPPIQRLVDRVSAVFVPVVIAASVLTALGWLLAGAGAVTAVIDAVAVLVIACPCALGLATPAAIMAGTGVAARHGILIRDPAALERARTLRLVVFDKTGTLTEGAPALTAVIPAADVAAPALLEAAAALQAGSEHPLARAVLARHTASRSASALRAVPGAGVIGTIDGDPAALGTAALMAREGIDTVLLAAEAARLAQSGETVAYVARGGRLLGLLGFGDQVRAGAAEAVAALGRRGLPVALLTGDNRGAAEAVASALGIARVEAEALPEDKLRHVRAWREAGGVAMVGDGVNDAAALAAADIGIAMGSGTDVAASAAAITLMRPDPRLVAAAIDIAARTERRIRQGLFWAFAYNVVGIPLAALGLLSPVLAGAAMAFSSASVVGSALLLRRWRP